MYKGILCWNIFLLVFVCFIGFGVQWALNGGYAEDVLNFNIPRFSLSRVFRDVRFHKISYKPLILEADPSERNLEKQKYKKIL